MSKSDVSPIDPAKFVVRNINYPQQDYYPGWCVEVLEKLKKHPPHSMNTLLEYIAKEIRDDAAKPERTKLHPLIKKDDKKLYGTLRDKDKPNVAQTPLMGGDTGSYPDFLKRQFGNKNYNKPFKHTFPIQQIEEGKGGVRRRTIDLSSIANNLDSNSNPLPPGETGQGRIFHSKANGYDDEHLWSMIAQDFYDAMNAPRKSERIEAAIDLYYLLSHDCPLRRRSATLARLCLAYLEEVIGFDVPFTKPDIDLNLEALTRNREDFISAYYSGEFFDNEITGSEIMRWHAEQSLKQKKVSDALVPYFALHEGLRQKIREGNANAIALLNACAVDWSLVVQENPVPFAMEMHQREWDYKLSLLSSGPTSTHGK